MNCVSCEIAFFRNRNSQFSQCIFQPWLGPLPPRCWTSLWRSRCILRRIPTVKLKIPGKSRIQKFCYIQVIVFDLGYLPVAAVRTWQVRLHLSPSKMEFISISERYILVSFKMHISIWKNIHGIQFKHFLWFLHRIFSTVLMRC